MTLQEIEDAIVAQAEKRRAEGWTIVRNSFGKEANKTCCPLSALDSGVFDYARTNFEWTDAEIWDFIDGVDELKSEFNPDIHALGIRVRERLGL
jgi:hypothetical protein